MTATYLKEISSGTIHKFQEKETPAFPELFIPATQSEIDALLLHEAKEKKHHQLTNDYLKANLEDKMHEGKIIQGKGIGTIRQFKFKQKYNNSIPALDTDRFLNICIISDKPLPYETEAVEGDKIVVQITPTKAKEILNHMINRYQMNYAVFTVQKNKLDICKNIDEVDKIIWDPNVITQDQLTQISKLLNS